MEFYAYITLNPGCESMNDEPLGSMGRMIIREYKTVRGAVNKCKRLWEGKSFKVYSFTNFYDDKTFKLKYVNYGE